MPKSGIEPRCSPEFRASRSLHSFGGGPRPGVLSESKMCTMTKGLLLHVDPPVKQIILDLDDRFSNSIVKFELVVSASTSALYEGCP